MYRQKNASIAERMKVLDFAKSLQKQDTDSGKSGQMVSNPNQQVCQRHHLAIHHRKSSVSTPEEMNAMVTSGKVYKSGKEALADAEQRLRTYTDITAHIGTIGQANTDGLDGDAVMTASTLMALRSQIEETRNFVEMVRLKDMSKNHGEPPMMPPQDYKICQHLDQQACCRWYAYARLMMGGM